MMEWQGIPRRVREVVEQHRSTVSLAQVHRGNGSDLAATLRTDQGDVFLKVIDLQRPRAEIRRIEVRVQEYLPPWSPRLLWHAEEDGWLVMCFEHVPGRHVDISPGSVDLGAVADVLHALSGIKIPNLPVLPIEKRWAPFASADVLARLQGTTLVHTDLVPANILRGSHGVRIVDWAWPTLGAPWLDTNLMVPRLILAGHTPEAAEAWASGVPAWRTAVRESIGAAVLAHLGLARERLRGAT